MIYNTSIYNMRENCLSHGHNDITFALEITCFLSNKHVYIGNTGQVRVETFGHYLYNDNPSICSYRRCCKSRYVCDDVTLEIKHSQNLNLACISYII